MLLVATVGGLGTVPGEFEGLVAATTADGADLRAEDFTAWAGTLLIEEASDVGFCLLLVATDAGLGGLGAVPEGFKGLATADGVDLGADGTTDFTA